MQIIHEPSIVVALGVFVASSAWFTFGWKRRVRCAGLVSLCIVLCALPWLCRWEPLLPRAIVALVCCGLLLPKLIDACLVADDWRDRRLWEWLIFLPHSCRLIHRPQWRFPDPGRWNGSWLLLRGTIEIAIGALLLRWLLHSQLSFWRYHAVTVAVAYLIGFDGAFVFLCGFARILGIKVIDFSRHPILARTPADFWRRYNREAGRLLHENLFKPLGGLRHPRRATFLTFLINGIFHEYLALVVVGALMGYQIAFFVIHGVATVATLRMQPRGVATVVGTLLTFLLLLTSSVLFFASIGWYPQWKSIPQVR